MSNGVMAAPNNPSQSWNASQGAGRAQLKDLELLLKELKWTGSANELASFLPQYHEQLSLDQMRDVLLKAGYQSEVRTGYLDAIPVFDLPALGLLKNGKSVLITGTVTGGVKIQSGGKTISPDSDEKIRWLELEPRSKKPSPRGIWFHQLLGSFDSAIVSVLILSLINAVLGLALPLFTMSVYDFLIPSGSLSGLVAVGSGAFIALVWMVVLNRMRAKMLSRLAANISYQTGRSLFAKLISLPAEYLLPNNAFQNIARIRDIDRVREFLGGIMAASLFDVPFVIVALIAIAWLSGWLVLVPVFGVVIYALMLLYFNSRLHEASMNAAKSGQRLQEHVRQALDGLVELREANVQSGWLDTFAQESVRAARSNFNYRMANAAQQAAGKQVSMLIALATLMCGIYFAMTGIMTAGGLIAAMMLIWRVTGPLQMAFLSATRVRQFKQAVQQINSMMDMPSEQLNERDYSKLEGQRASFSIDRLVYRYSSDRDAALNGVSLKIESGKKVAVVGPNGSGKTTLLQCIAGVLHPQAGTVLMDDYDIRQFKSVDYRNFVAYIGRDNNFIEGTIAENLAASAPLAEESAMHEALAEFGLDEYISANYQGLDTILMQDGEMLLDEMLGFGIKLARARLRQAEVYLLDDIYEPSDHPVMMALEQFIKTNSFGKTIIYATHDKDLMLQGDVAVIMEKGSVSQVAELNQEDGQSDPAQGDQGA